MNKNKLKNARNRLTNFSAKSDRCPLCHKDFKNGCNHSIEQALDRLEQNVINAMIDKRLSKIFKIE
jgi:hypothetical protein